MMNGILKSLMLISTLCLLSYSTMFSKKELYMYTKASNCNTCYSYVLDGVRNFYHYFDSLSIDYKITLECKRARDINYFREFHNLDSNLEIINVNTIDDKILKHFKNVKKEHFVYTVNDSVMFETNDLYKLLNYLSTEHNSKP